MYKFNRNQRISAITKMLTENPNKIINLNKFTNVLNAAKSTVSEDLVIIRELLSKLSLGRIDTISGASGGVKYICDISKEEKMKFAEELCIILRDKNRIIPGNFIYMTDIMYNPDIIYKAAIILASKFYGKEVDYVVTVETKGIPLAYEVSKMLGVQLIIVRRDPKVTEGPTISINYVSGSSGRIQTMSLSKRSIKNGSKCIFVDDFMKAGGTAFGIIDLLKEFECEVLGMGILVDDIESPRKLVTDYFSIVEFKGIEEDGTASLCPSNKL